MCEVKCWPPGVGGFPLMLMLACTSPSALLAEEGRLDESRLSSAVRKAIPLLEKASAGSADQRTCFTCHNQTLPILALTKARDLGFTVDAENLKRQVTHTYKHLERGRENYQEGRGQGGRVLTAGYALWGLEAGGTQADETTAAVAHYLLNYQNKQPYWKHRGSRPPSSGSDFTASYVALRGLDQFGTKEQAEQIAQRSRQVKQWALKAEAKETEDLVFQLRLLDLAGATKEEIDNVLAELRRRRLKDGGWGQTSQDDQSDAYATATVVVALMEAGKLSSDNEDVRAGLKYLLDTQLPDGTWHVVTRADGFQTYFESGYPHGEDQFISVTAASWATLALTLAFEEEKN